MLPLQSNKSKSKYSSFTMKSISITQLSGVVQKNFLELCLWQLPQFLTIQQGLYWIVLVNSTYCKLLTKSYTSFYYSFKMFIYLAFCIYLSSQDIFTKWFMTRLRFPPALDRANCCMSATWLVTTRSTMPRW